MHVGQDTGTNEGRKRVADEVSTEENGVPQGQFLAGVPFAEQQKRAGQECSFNKAEKESNDHHVCKGLGVTRESGYKPPKKHCTGNVQGRPFDTVDEDI